MQRLSVGLLAAFLALAPLASGRAQSASEFPSPLVKVIVPFAPGGAADALARPVAERLQNAWKVSVIV